MRWMRIVWIWLAVICAAVSLGYLAMHTTTGSRMIADQMISVYVDHDGLDYEALAGNLSSGLTFRNLDIKDIHNLPAGTIVKIQRLTVNLTSLDLNGLAVEMENIRVILPESEPIVISGTFREQQLNLNVYSKGFTVSEIVNYLPNLKALIPIRGDVDGIDLFVSGPYREPTVTGSLRIESFLYKGFLLKNTPVAVDLRLADIKDDIKLYGSIYLESGDLQTTRVIVNLDKGRLTFDGPWNQPQMNLAGTARVEKTRIRIGLKGTPDNPELTLSSEPSYSRQKLMIMLATGKSWRSVEEALDQGPNSMALTRDFVDYFFFAGKTGQFAQRFGVSDVSVKFNENQRGIAAKKALSDKIAVGYGIEQNQTNGIVTDVSQRLEGEYQVSDQLSVGLQREVEQRIAPVPTPDPVIESHDKIYFRYKMNF